MSKLTSNVRPLAFALAIALSACGGAQGSTPGRAGLPAATPYDAPHLDAGNATDMTGVGNTSLIDNGTAGPHLVP